jgi:thioredoxin domain-containing protein 5
MKSIEKKACFWFLIIIIVATLFYTYKKLSSGTMENFENSGDSNVAKFTLFHWDDCGHCKNMMPDWEKLEKAYPNSTAKYEKSDITETQMDEFGISGYPTICIVKDGKKIEEYNGGRTYDEMETFLKENISSQSTSS